MIDSNALAVELMTEEEKESRAVRGARSGCVGGTARSIGGGKPLH